MQDLTSRQNPFHKKSWRTPEANVGGSISNRITPFTSLRKAIAMFIEVLHRVFTSTAGIAKRLRQFFNATSRRSDRRGRATLPVQGSSTLASPTLESLEARALLAGEAVISESVFDLQQFEQNLRDTYLNNSVGFAYAANYGGVTNVISGADGDARTATDTRIFFTPHTEMTIASVAKPVTAVALLHLLDAQNIPISTPIVDYLPTNWTVGPNIAPGAFNLPNPYGGVTFEDLLTHRSGFRRIDWDGSGRASLEEQTEDAGLQQLIATGIGVTDLDGNGSWDSDEGRDWLRSNYSYENANFALIRVMLPYIWNQIPNSVVDGTASVSSLPDAVEEYVTDDWDGLLNLARIRASIYKYYVRQNVFRPMGILTAETEGFGDFQTLNYPFPHNNEDGTNPGDRSLLAGGEGWYLSARELSTFLHYSLNTDAVLSPTMRQLMKDQYLGWQDPEDRNDASIFGQDVFGLNFGHGGALSNLGTGVLSLANGLQAAVMLNSPPAAGIAASKLEIHEAYMNAWTEVTIAGRDDSVTGGVGGGIGTVSDDTFVVQDAAEGPFHEVVLNGKVVYTFPTSGPLQKLRLKGLGGNDTFEIRSTSSFVDLELLGGRGNDTFDIADGDWNDNAATPITIYGGAGDEDSIAIDDSTDTGDDEYRLFGQSVAKVGQLLPSIDYDDVEYLTLDANNDSNRIVVSAIPGSTALTINAGGDNDTVIVEDSLVFSDLTVNGQGGNDDVIVRDTTVYAHLSVNGHNGRDTLTLRDATMRGSARLSGGAGVDSLLGEDVNLTDAGALTLDGNEGDDTVRAVDVTGLTGSLLNQYGGDQKDTLIINAVRGGVAVHMLGGAGNDSLRVYESDLSTPLRAYGGTGNDFIRLGGGDISRRLSGRYFADGEDGNDHFVLEDRNGTGSHDFYVFNESRPDRNGDVFQTFDKSGFAGSIEYTDAETVTLKGTRQDSTTNIRSVPRRSTLNVNVVDGDDSVRIHESDALSRINIKGGNGADVVTVSPEDRNLDRVAGVVSFDGEGGTGDRLHLLDDHSTGSNALQIGGGTFIKDDREQWTHLNLETITLQANDDDNTLHIDGVRPQADVIVNLNGGNDDAYLAQTTRDLDSAIEGNLTIRAGDNNGRGDRIFLYDQRDLHGDDSYTINNVYFQKNTTERWILSQFEHQRLYASQNDNKINVQRFGSLFSDPTLRIFGNGGDDTLEVGHGFNRTTFVYDDFEFTGGTGDDAIVINDRQNNSNGTYTLNAGKIDLGQLKATITYSSVSDVNIESGMRNDTVHVESNSADVNLNLFGGTGSDTFNIAKPTRDWDDVPGEIRITGDNAGSPQPDVDTVNVYDSNDTGNDTYTIDSPTYIETRMARSAGSFVQYSGIDTSYLAAGRGNNTVNIPWIVEGQDLKVNGGPGNDTFNVNAISTLFAVNGSITAIGGGGNNDRLRVIDELLTPDDYTVTRNSVSRPDILPIRYFSMERLFLNTDVGDNFVNITSTHPNTIVSVDTGAGSDHVRIVRPSSRVNVNGGIDGSNGDRVTLVGSNGNDLFTVRGETITRDSVVVATLDVERRVINGLAGEDQLKAVGVAGTDEVFRITPSATTPHAGVLTTGTFSTVQFANVPNIKVNGNGADNDRLAFVGTNGSDQFTVNMSAAGTVKDPYLKFSSVSGAALTLLGYGGTATPRLLGRDGADTFDVYVADRGPASGRRVKIIGGNPSGRRVLGADQLNLHYPRSQATVKHLPTDDDSGSIDALFSTRRFNIEYDEIEDVLLLPF